MSDATIDAPPPLGMAGGTTRDRGGLRKIVNNHSSSRKRIRQKRRRQTIAEEKEPENGIE
jgi:hypothetical protein